MAEEGREEIEEIINNEEPITETVIETTIEEEEEEVKAKRKSKPKAKTKAKPQMKLTKEPVEEAVQTIEEETIVEEQPAPVKVDRINKIVQCPGCGLSMTQHTLLYIHKRRGFCKAEQSTSKNTRTNTRTTKTNNYRRSCK